MNKILLIDIGATNTRLAIGWEKEGHPVISDLILTQTPISPEELVNRVILYAEERQNFDSISIASIGPLDLRKGWILETPNIELGPYPIVDVLKEKIATSVLLLNDCQASVWGEYIYGRYKGMQNMVYITLSSGVGAGAIVDGHLLNGRSGNAHEVGHLVLDYNGRAKCGCGGLGHWEAYVGGKNIPRNAKELLVDYSGPVTRFYKRAIAGNFSAEELFNQVSKGDKAGIHILSKIIEITAAGIANVIAVYDPEVILLGGTVYHNGISKYLESLKTAIKNYAFQDNVIITSSSYPGKEPLIGALAYGIFH